MQHALRIGTGDRIARARSTRVVLGCQHHGDGGPVLPLQGRQLVQVPCRGGVEGNAQRRLEESQNGLGLGIAEAAIEFDHCRPVCADGQAGMSNGEGTHVINMPHIHDVLAPILYTIPLQLLSYYVAVLKGTDVDQPRNLAKSVTVE